MLIDGPNDVYMLDRDNQVFQVPGLTFWKRKQLQNPLTNTLVDGEMVVDTVGAQPVPRYLIYDLIKFEVSERKIFYTQFTTIYIFVVRLKPNMVVKIFYQEPSSAINNFFVFFRTWTFGSAISLAVSSALRRKS